MKRQLSVRPLRNRRSFKRAVGFSALEFLLVLGIAGLLFSILIPKIAAIRESARQVHCLNNLRQNSLALFNYQAMHQTFPPGYISMVDTEGTQIRNEWAWQAFLLHFLDNGSLVSNIDFNYSTVTPSSTLEAADVAFQKVVDNQVASEQTLNVTICPSSDSPEVILRRILISEYAGYGRSDYSAVSGIQWSTLPCKVLKRDEQEQEQEQEQESRKKDVPDCQPNDGVMFLNSSTRIDDILDGQSQTLLIAETSTNFDFQLGDFSVSRTIGGRSNLFWGGTQWAAVSHPFAQDEVLTATVEGIDSNPRSERRFMAGPNSYHEGRVGVSFCDGSARMISVEIDSSPVAPYGVLQRLSTIAGQELIKGF